MLKNKGNERKIKPPLALLNIETIFQKIARYFTIPRWEWKQP
jgi:hypothetical protein